MYIVDDLDCDDVDECEAECRRRGWPVYRDYYDDTPGPRWRLVIDACMNCHGPHSAHLDNGKCVFGPGYWL